jgi:dihydrofolate reductase
MDKEKIRQFAIVVAHDSKLGIGKNGGLPWKIAGDLQNFRNLTTSVTQPNDQNVLVMGRRTWDSIAPQHRPLTGRINLVLTHDQSLSVPPQVVLCHSIDETTKLLDSMSFDTCFAIGGASIFRYALLDKRFSTIHLTEVEGDFKCDVFFPAYKDAFKLLDRSPARQENGYTYRFSLYKRAGASQ